MKLCFVLSTLLLLLAAAARAGQLQEVPVTGDDIQRLISLDGDAWTAANGDGTIVIGATVPGDLISDLQRANVIQDPLFNLTFQEKVWDSSQWTYTSPPFDTTRIDLMQEVYLVFDGIKMAADVAVNNHHVGTYSDQFLRHVIPVKQHLAATNNFITVVFRRSNDAMNNETRWMGCSGGWDWAPYSATSFIDGTRTFSKGIIKSVYLVPVQTAALASVVPQMFYTGPYPREPLSDETASPFNVSVKVHFLCPPISGCNGNVTVTVSWEPNTTTISRLVSQNSSAVAELVLPVAVGVKLWWPNGLGESAMHVITVEYQGVTNMSNKIVSSRRIGFRTAFLVTTNETNEDATGNGSGNFTMRYKVNGANVYLRGANMIPMEELEARQSAIAYTALVDSAADANYNILRIWGGGIFLPPAFYDRCDERGIMIFHDMMYGQPWFANGGSGGTPRADAMQAAELKFNIRNLVHHPSIATWNGGNEWCSSLDVWTNFVMPTILQEDMTRPIWPTSPSTGFQTGVNSLTGLPNGQPLTAAMNNWKSPIETHGPYQHGSGFKTVNSAAELILFPPNMPPVLSEGQSCGVHLPGTFATEFGCSVFSSFESMSATLPEPSWSPHSSIMFQRNYACDSIIDVYFGKQPDLNTTVGSVAVLRKTSYMCMVGQALEMKGDIEHRRSTNAFGTVTWQLNEIWPTGGWGSLEYGSVGWTSGQILGGRWKPLHHWMSEHLYKDAISVCGSTAMCYVKNDDALKPFVGLWTASLVNFQTGAQTIVAQANMSLPKGAGSIAWICAATGRQPSSASSCPSYATLVGKNSLTLTNALLRLTLRNAQQEIVDQNDVFMVPFAQIVSSANFARNTSVFIDIERSPDQLGRYAVKVHTAAYSAFFVQLTTAAHGRFDKNAFLVTPADSPQTVHFIPSPLVQFDIDVWSATTRVEHAAQYLV